VAGAKARKVMGGERAGAVALSKKTRAEDLSVRIEALQCDLAAFRLSHGGDPELDAKVVAWLKAILTETCQRTAGGRKVPASVAKDTSPS
jgi:hypothetical protein